METGTHKRNRLREQQGFTLLEMLIAVIVLGILAMVIIPQITVSTDDAKVSTCKADLSAMRSAIETYYHQHGSAYPGANKSADGTAVTSNDECVTAFVDQMTKYSQTNGKAHSDSGAAGGLTGTLYGPYIKGGSMPTNPFNNLNTVACDYSTTNIATRAVDGTTGWKYMAKTGVIFANDNTSSGGTAHSTY